MEKKDAKKEPYWPEPLDFSDIKNWKPKEANFYFDTVGGKDWVTLKWGGYEYDIAMDRFPTPMALLQWLTHLGEKEWEGMTSFEVQAFIKAICDRKGWDLWHPSV